MPPVLTASLAIILGAALSLAAVGWLLVRLPEDYFAKERHPLRDTASRPLLRLLKNLLGLVLFLLGVVLSLPGVPGQGLLTILVALFLLDFPGKYRLERAIISRGPVLRAANRLRGSFGRPPFSLGEGSAPP